MAMKRCPECGEKYSDTYKYCPFCEEEGALRDGEVIRRGGRRVAGGGRGPNLLTPTLVVLILIMAGLLVYLLWGDKIAAKLAGDGEGDTPPIADVTPVEPADPDGGQEEPAGQETPADPDDTMPEGQEPADPVTPPADSENPDYDKAAKLPNGLTLSTTDFTLKTLGESHTIAVSGGSGSYTWLSEDDGIASVDSKGKVVAVSGGTTNVLVTDGSKKAVCIVRVSAAADAPAGTPDTPSTGGALRPGSAVVINGGNGVRVRSGPSTNDEVLATVPNGADINIVESAGGDWYKITFSGNGGVKTTGYMKGEFLSNK